MHNLYFAIVPKDKAKDSAEAREVAMRELVINSFFDQEWLWSSGKWDWGVVWGRRSWVLVEKDDDPDRDSYKDNGMDDDALILTKEIIKSLQSRWYWETEVYDMELGEEIDIDTLWDNHLWHWIVVIDYHN